MLNHDVQSILSLPTRPFTKALFASTNNFLYNLAPNSSKIFSRQCGLCPVVSFPTIIIIFLFVQAKHLKEYSKGPYDLSFAKSWSTSH